MSPVANPAASLERRPGAWARGYALVVSVFFAAAVLAPGIPVNGEAKNPDGFPFSTYPMFRGDRPERERLTYVVSVDGEGARHRISVTWWTSGGMNEGRAQVLRAVDAGEGDAFCARIAEKVAKRTSGWAVEAVEVLVLRGHWSRERYFLGDKQPDRERVLSRCVVPRS